MTFRVATVARVAATAWVCAIAGLLMAAPAAGQFAAATIAGTVTDETGAVTRAVHVTIIDTATTLLRETSTSQTGRFVLTDLPPGRYSLSAELKGFATIEVRRLVVNVGDHLELSLKLQVAKIGERISVSVDPARVSISPAVRTVIDRQFVDTLPLNGRSFQSLLTVVPGVVFTGQSTAGGGQFSVNGQRTNTNYYTVDGVGANVESSSNYWADQEVAGVTPALNAVGGTQSLLSADALEEFSIQTSTYSAEFGRQPGAQVSLVSRAGTDTFHGSVFEYFRTDGLTATDWFTKANHLPKAQLRQNQFGGSGGGPLRRGRTFFFATYEGLRLLQPMVVSTDVPSVSLRAEAFPALQPLLASLPLPTGPENPATRTAPFLAGFSAPSSFDASSIRVDQVLTDRARLFGRVSYSPSSAGSRNLNNVVTDRPVLFSATGGLTQTIGTAMTHDLRVNDTSNKRTFQTAQDDFGGATPISPADLLPPGIPASMPVRIQLSLDSIASPYYTRGQYQRQHQVNVVDTWAWAKGNHLLKAGADYRELRPASQPWEYFYFVRFNTVTAIQTGEPSSTSSSIQALDRVDLRFRNLGAFVHDTWRLSPRLTVDLGLRWDLNPPPTTTDGRTFATVTGFEQPSTLALAPSGTPLYPTDDKAFGPRTGATYVLSDREGHERVVRGGFGVYHDLSAGEAGRVTIGYPYVRSRDLPAGLAYPFTPAAVARPDPANANPPYNGQTFVAFPDHQTSHTYEWNVTWDQSIGRENVLTVAYVGAAGRNLLRRENYQLTNPNATFTGLTSVDVSRTNATSDYKALQLQFRRRLSRGLQVLASYTLSTSEDTVSSSSLNVFSKSDKIDPNLFLGPSDFDRRHVFSLAATYAVPSTRPGWLGMVARDWSLSTIVQAQSAAPVLVYTNRDLGFGSFEVLPDAVPGVPVYLTDPSIPGERRLNPAAFSVPVDRRMGDVPRNSVRGFPFRQIDLSIVRGVPLGRGARAQVRLDLFNALNTANFGAPSGFLGSTSPTGVLTPSSGFGKATSTLDNTLGGSNGVYKLFANGGPRSTQLSVRLTF